MHKLEAFDQSNLLNFDFIKLNFSVSKIFWISFVLFRFPCSLNYLLKIFSYLFVDIYKFLICVSFANFDFVLRINYSIFLPFVLSNMLNFLIWFLYFCFPAMNIFENLIIIFNDFHISNDWFSKNQIFTVVFSSLIFSQNKFN